MFQSAPPARAATPAPAPSRPPRPCVSIRAARAGGDVRHRLPVERHRVSIRAARAGGDMFCHRFCIMKFSVSIRAARAGGDWIDLWTDTETEAFQSAPPARAATVMRLKVEPTRPFQSAPPARAATSPSSRRFDWMISFQSAPPARAATPHSISTAAHPAARPSARTPVLGRARPLLAISCETLTT